MLQFPISKLVFFPIALFRYFLLLFLALLSRWLCGAPSIIRQAEVDLKSVQLQLLFNSRWLFFFFLRQPAATQSFFYGWIKASLSFFSPLLFFLSLHFLRLPFGLWGQQLSKAQCSPPLHCLALCRWMTEPPSLDFLRRWPAFVIQASMSASLQIKKLYCVLLNVQ